MKLLTLLIETQFLLIYPALGQIDWHPYPGELSKDLQDRVKFGYLAIPENHDNLNSRKIKMAFTVIKSSARQPFLDPVVLLPGGPGYGFSPFLERIYQNEIFQKVNARRDLILIDPRGCGFSYPTLCENINDPDLQKELTFLSKEERTDLQKMAWSECAEHLSQAGADVHGYSSIQIAHDLEKLRQALGYQSWNIRGHSYGSYYGFVLMQTYPESIRSAFLSGIVNRELFYNFSQFDTRNVMKNLIEACNNDSACTTHFPNFEKDLKTTFLQLEKEPLPVTYLNSKKERITGYITPELLIIGIQTLLYDKAGIEFMPALIHAIANGNKWILENLSVSLLNSWLFSDGLRQDMLTIIQNNDLPVDPTYLAPDQSTQVLPWLKTDWLPDETGERQYVWNIIQSSDSIRKKDWRVLGIPTLLLSGGLDPVTPAYRGEEALQNFSKASHHVVPGSGHYAHNDAKVDFAVFLDNPDPSIPFESISEISPLRFITDVSLNKGFSSFLANIQNQNYKVLIAPLLSILLSLVGLLYFPLSYLLKKMRNKERKLSAKDVLPFWLLSATVVAIVGLLVAAILNALSVNPYMLSMGLPSRWDFIPYIAMIAIVILIYNLNAIFRVWGKKSGHVPILISQLGGLGFLVFFWWTSWNF